MKSYREYPLWSVSMHDSAELRHLLRDVIVRRGIRHVVETGTHEGVGSTRFVAESFPPDAGIRTFVTIEAGWKSWRRGL
jgi:predicted O-methyltransferase YrrM